MGGPTRIRDRRVRLADNLTDGQSPSQIELAIPSSTTEEDYQVFYLSRMREIIWGNNPSHHWYDDFEGQGISPLYQQAINFLLENDPNSVGVTYTPTYTNFLVSSELWAATSSGTPLKASSYTYSGVNVLSSVIQVFGTDGVTVIGQTSTTYTYSGTDTFVLISSASTRDV